MINCKILSKIIGIVIMMELVLFPTISRAGIWSDIFKNADDFVEEGTTQIDQKNLKETSSDIYFILLYIGVGASVIIGAILGIQFMMASAEDKAKVKEQMIPYIIGCAVMFGAFGIWSLVVNVLNGVV